ncbi:MAG: DUF3047 domain-containing protein, partial [Kordiimonadaceae bacterium]|nr:DUF3047 domain-containing protein [Kordiimonadaceae bacterium]
MSRVLSIVVLSFLLIMEGTPAEVGEKVSIATFTNDEMSDWTERSFEKHTNYQLIGEETPLALKASCEDQASVLYRRVSVDLTKTPFLHWSWRVEEVHPNLDDTTKDGDDYAARLYVVYSKGSILPWRAKAVNYVWANSQPIGSAWPSAFTDDDIMVAQQSGQPVNPGEWIHEVRNVREDFNKLFGQDIKS